MHPSEPSRIFNAVRFTSVIAVIASALASILMYVVGAIKVGLAFHSYFGGPLFEDGSESFASGAAITYVVQALDAFLIAIVLMIFGGGVFNLFIRELPTRQRNLFNIRSIAELKGILAELVIVILMVKFLEESLRARGAYSWEMLTLPVGVLLIAVAVRLLQFKRYES
ncbi:MAG: YqhA family protein [Planctomycetota bacterium]